MGLTIHYEISFKGTADELYKKLLAVRSKCRDLPFEVVNEVEHLVYSKEDIEFFDKLQDDTFYPNNTEENLEARNQALEDRGLDINTLIGILVYQGGKAKKYEFMKFMVWPGEGCESADLNFFKKRKYWRCESFCKTQFATEFVKCHLLIITLFDIMKQEGFIVKVNDEGGYWRTRNLNVLAKNINEYTGLLQSISGVLGKMLKNSDMTFESEVDKSANIIKIDGEFPEE